MAEPRGQARRLVTMQLPGISSATVPAFRFSNPSS
jgi:hypothetical protein